MKKTEEGEKRKGVGVGGRREMAGRSTAPRGGEGSQRGGVEVVEVGGRWLCGTGEEEEEGEGQGGDKAKVYESKGTPNYSYTIHD